MCLNTDGNFGRVIQESVMKPSLKHVKVCTQVLFTGSLLIVRITPCREEAGKMHFRIRGNHLLHFISH